MQTNIGTAPNNQISYYKISFQISHTYQTTTLIPAYRMPKLDSYGSES